MRPDVVPKKEGSRIFFSYTFAIDLEVSAPFSPNPSNPRFKIVTTVPRDSPARQAHVRAAQTYVRQNVAPNPPTSFHGAE
jgi:hypothetical protein